MKMQDYIFFNDSLYGFPRPPPSSSSPDLYVPKKKKQEQYRFLDESPKGEK
jgi:hypothetical protein